MRDGWVERTLGDVTECSWGNTGITKTKYVDSGYLAYSASGADGFLKSFEHDRSAVILSAIGAQCGKTWFADGKWTAIKNTIWLKSNNSVLLDEYLYYLSNREQFWQIRGQAQPFISLGDVKKTKVLLPSLQEQKRIVDLISSMDSYVEALRWQFEVANKFRNSVLHDLFRGGDNGWKRLTVTEVSKMIKRGHAPLYTEEQSVTVLNQKCVRNGRLNLEFSRQTDANLKPVKDWAYLNENDTVVNSTGVGTLGRTAFVGRLSQPTTVDSHVTIVRPNPEIIEPGFLGLMLHFKEQEIEGFATGSSGQTELSREALGSLVITVPPIHEQKRIVDFISSIDDMTFQMEITLENSKDLRSGLSSELLLGKHEIPATYDKVMDVA
jgi:restriction endonuclease S subunit